MDTPPGAHYMAQPMSGASPIHGGASSRLSKPGGGGPPEQALRFFEQLYRIEKQARDQTPDAGETQVDCIRRFRQQHSLPVLIALKIWLDTIAPKVVPDTKPGDATGEGVANNTWHIAAP